MIPREDFIPPFDLQHQHADGTYHPLRRVHHDPTEHDPEKGWLRRQEFECIDCPERIALIPGETS